MSYVWELKDEDAMPEPEHALEWVKRKAPHLCLPAQRSGQ